ncbi:hypothetical protein DFP72DRAFT_842117 [Ephemerocybe angulata]|uniref:RRM domain-containing protein n=1 Tax=Ephemerocybe angulata TaxID=980116 RepID=A0A8H6IDX8_9AGAR|nr:hypothetical protein DFP72DRAFT_842117 [Tulosesus angulatus]
MNMQPDFPNEYETNKLPPHGGKLNGFGANNNYRSSFTSFPNNNRPPPQSFRDPHGYYPPSNDMYPSQTTSPMGSFDSPHGSFDFGNGGHKGYLEGYNTNAASLLSHHNNPKSNGPMVQQQTHGKFVTGPPYSGGVQLTSQTPYGPHVPIGAGGNSGNPAPPAPSVNTPNAPPATNSSGHEEISTIFVVGFPEDMQEREFQNMFTFSPGFEAATLKIPNKEYTAYGARGFQGYSGPNDPYNLVTVNQGGVVVDGGRDGTMSSWPAAPGDDNNPHFVANGNLAPRKQIIGFAKFKSRDAALEARDILQGRRVDIEKGAVLKAEMAKKNLHTKRGVGPVAGPALPTTTPSSNQQMQNPSHPNGLNAGSHIPDAYAIPSDSYSRADPIDLARPPGGNWRDQLQRDVHAVTNGIGSSYASEFHPRKDRDDDDTRRRDRESSIYSAMGFPNAVGQGPPTRGPRERAEDEERRRKEKDRLRSSSNAFDAFHSVPSLNAAPPLSRQNSGLNGVSLLPPMEPGTSLGSSPLLASAFTNAPNINHQSAYSAQQHHDDLAVGPWDNVHAGGISASRSSSQRSTSPEDDIHDTRFTSEDDQYEHRTQSEASLLNGPGVIGGPGSMSEDENDIDLSKVMSDLVLNTDNGTTSPQLPSPASGASSTSTRNAVDQNPPINTLYVGNLPTSPPPLGFAQDYLEESIRQLFSVQPGYRRMAFRQKSNGPMCFVEFEDVTSASKALNELYGNTLNGLVKHGGIRLSYSKNPLGVRTPTSATSPTSSLAQQQQAMQSLAFHQEQFRGDEPSQATPIGILRRDGGAAGNFGNTFMTSPPPRFTSPPATHVAQTSLTNSSTFSHRTNGGSLSSLYSYNITTAAGGANSVFAPFGGPPTIPEQSSSDDLASLHSQHFHRTLSPPVNSVEATRAG